MCGEENSPNKISAGEVATETQSQLKPAWLRLSAIISQYLMLGGLCCFHCINFVTERSDFLCELLHFAFCCFPVRLDEHLAMKPVNVANIPAPASMRIQATIRPSAVKGYLSP